MKLQISEQTVDELLNAIGTSTVKGIMEKGEMPEFLNGATNVYRTSLYIVKQEISFVKQDEVDLVMMSEDTFYLRNDNLDELYESYFMKRKDIDGKRMKTKLSTRKYVE